MGVGRWCMPGVHRRASTMSDPILVRWIYTRMNQVANEEANRARCAALGKPSLPLDIYGEELHVMYLEQIWHQTR